MISDLFEGLRGLGNKGPGYRARKRRRREIGKLEQSGLFDRSWYLEAYPDVRDSGADPIRHYLESGWREGRDPGPNFCTTAYLKANSDVAALGINPLLHYVEHGRWEGRGAPLQGGPLRAAMDPVEKFGPAAPCARFPLPPLKVIPWARAGRIREDGNDVAKLGSLAIAKAGNASERLIFDQALSRLAWLSGNLEEAMPEGPAIAGTSLEMLDAWYAGSGVFRMRWQLGQHEAVVVRAIQQTGGEPELVGEACIGSGLDLLDIRLASPFFPLLFLFTEPDGKFLGVRHVTFPALCRGNLHYPELVALSQRDGIDPMDVASVDERLTRGLIALRQGAATPLVAEVIVDLEGSDGSHPLFQIDFQAWLARVMGVPVRALSCEEGNALEYLAGALKVEADDRRAKGMARLRLASDMVPALSALSASGEGGGPSQELAGPLIVISEEASGVSTYVHVTPGTTAADFGGSKAVFATLVPVGAAQGVAGELPLLAIRLPRRRKTTDTELLIPQRMFDRDRTRNTNSITWLIWPRNWNEPDLAQSLVALAQQTIGMTSIIFVGQPMTSTMAMAQRLFRNEVRAVTGLGSARAIIETGLCGYLGPGTVLHDPHTVERLNPVLDGSDVLTVTAPVVFAERRGKGAVAAPADSDDVADARLFAGAVVPIGGPARHFWIARSESARQWLQAQTEFSGRHLCSTLVSVSTVTPGTIADSPFTFPAAGQHRVISAEMVIG